MRSAACYQLGSGNCRKTDGRMVALLQREKPDPPNWDEPFARQQSCAAHVRFGSKAAVHPPSADVRFPPKSGHLIVASRAYPFFMNRRTCSTGQSLLALTTRTREPSA